MSAYVPDTNSITAAIEAPAFCGNTIRGALPGSLSSSIVNSSSLAGGSRHDSSRRSRRIAVSCCAAHH